MKIKSLKKFTTRFKQLAFGGEPDGEVLASHSIYDDKGNVIEETRIDDDGRSEKHTFEYNPQGKLTRHHLEIEMDEVSETFEYSRDDKGRVIQEVKLYGDDEGEKVKYTFGTHDQPISIERYDSDGELESIEKIIYDERDRLIEHHRFDNTNKLIEKSVIEYNEKDIPTGKQVFDGKNKLTSSTQMVYDDKNELVRVTEKKSDGKIVSDIITVYDDNGNVIERKIKDFHSRTLRFKYDERNNCIEEETYDVHGNLTMKSNYEFDENNRLVHESGYYLDMNRGAQMGNSQSRYVYEFSESS